MNKIRTFQDIKENFDCTFGDRKYQVNVAIGYDTFIKMVLDMGNLYNIQYSKCGMVEYIKTIFGEATSVMTFPDPFEFNNVRDVGLENRLVFEAYTNRDSDMLCHIRCKYEDEEFKGLYEDV